LFGQVADTFLTLYSADSPAELMPAYLDPERGAPESDHHADPERRHSLDPLRAL
jgi:hypothetical protein